MPKRILLRNRCALKSCPILTSKVSVQSYMTLFLENRKWLKRRQNKRTLNRQVFYQQRMRPSCVMSAAGHGSAYRPVRGHLLACALALRPDGVGRIWNYGSTGTAALGRNLRQGRRLTMSSDTNQDYEMTDRRQEKIAERLAQMPGQYQAIYRKAVSGRSRKAAMHSFCVECCGYQIKEVYLCTDLGCPLYPYRPRSRVSQGAPESIPKGPESKNSDQTVSEQGHSEKE